MNIFKTRHLAAALCVGILSLGSAHAATQNPGVYDASSVTTNHNDHTLWLPGVFGSGSNYWQFLDGASVFEVTEHGAVLDAVATQNGSGDGHREVRVHLTLDHAEEGASIKCAWTSTCDTSDWDFFSYVSGTITGVSDDLAGLVLDMMQHGPLAQLGTGANDKSGVFGFSSWFKLSAGDNNHYNGHLDLSRHGDLNLELAPVPLPAAGWMLLAGFAGLAGLRRKTPVA